jgi:hypothetical protein
LLWSLFLFNTLILGLWEFAGSYQKWLAERWPLRILAGTSGGLITTLAVWGLIDFRSFSLYGLIGYVIWLVLAYCFYRHKLPDLFVLAGGVLSFIVVVATGLAKLMLSYGGTAAGLLFIGLVVIVLSAAGSYWLKSIAQEEQS